MIHDSTLTSLKATLDDLQQRRIAAASLCSAWRAQTALLEDLPPRYAQVLEDLLGRLEASSLFAEESCSFSQDDLHEALNSWLDKARQTLAAHAS